MKIATTPIEKPYFSSHQALSDPPVVQHKQVAPEAPVTANEERPNRWSTIEKYTESKVHDLVQRQNTKSQQNRVMLGILIAVTIFLGFILSHLAWKNCTKWTPLLLVLIWVVAFFVVVFSVAKLSTPIVQHRGGISASVKPVQSRSLSQ